MERSIICGIEISEEVLKRIEANRLAALERKRAREAAEREACRPEEEKEIKKYLAAANRPFNANNIIDEFSRKFKKSNIIKALQVLVRCLWLRDFTIFSANSCG